MTPVICILIGFSLALMVVRVCNGLGVICQLGGCGPYRPVLAPFVGRLKACERCGRVTLGDGA